MQNLTFEDALRIARGCTDYGGGHCSNLEHYEIYQHGIQTVINALTAASKTGLEDTQIKALHAMGAEPDEPTTIEPAPCGDDKEHHYWTVVQEMSCPCCIAIRSREIELAEEDRKYRKLAQFIVEEQNAHRRSQLKLTHGTPNERLR